MVARGQANEYHEKIDRVNSVVQFCDITIT